jgi:uncharacterized protein (TIGR02597 family)
MVRSCLFLVCAAALSTGDLLSQSAVSTVPEGYITWSVPSTGASAFSAYFSIPLSTDAAYSGAVTAVTRNTLQVAGTPWQDDQLAEPDSPYFVLIKSGAQRGRQLLITANTSNSLTLSATDHTSETIDLTAPGFAVAVSDRIEVLPGDTISSLLGDGSEQNQLALVEGDDELSADTLGIYDAIASRWQVYYFDRAARCWRMQGSDVSQNDVILYPDAALAITRRPNRPALTLRVPGRVPDLSLLTKISGGSALSASYVGTRYPADVKLSDLNFSNWARSNDSNAADMVLVYNPASSQWDAYYQRPDGTWRVSGNADLDQSDFTIRAGSGIAILKRGALSGAQSLMLSPKPYNLN